jgi:hypothetical protein
MPKLKKPSFVPHPCPHPTNPSTPSPPLKIHMLTHVEMVKHQIKGLYYNCDENNFPRHKYKENKIFMAMSEEISKADTNSIPQEPLPPLVDDILLGDQHDVKPQIFLYALIDIFAPKNLKLIGYIKHSKVIILIDNVNTHNSTHY